MTKLIFSIEGMDGTGKSTLAAAVRDMLASQGRCARIVRELSATKTGERVANWIHSHDITADRETAREALRQLTEARMAAVQEIVNPAEPDKIIIYDRFVLTTWAYQNFNESWGLADDIRAHLKLISAAFENRVLYTFLLKLPIKEILNRVQARHFKGGILDPNDNQTAEHYECLWHRFAAAADNPYPQKLIGTVIGVDAQLPLNQKCIQILKYIQHA